MGRLPAVEDKRVRVVCYPGAELAHVYNLLRNRTPTSAGVTRVLLSFEINNRGHTSITALEKGWEGTEGEFKEFVNTLNQHHPSIKVKWELKQDAIDFLDTTTYKFKEMGRLDVRLYFKNTDTHALLHKGIHHDSHVFKGIMKAQLL